MVQVKYIANTSVALRWARQAKRGVQQLNNGNQNVQPLTSNKHIANKCQPSVEVDDIMARQNKSTTSIHRGEPFKTPCSASHIIRTRPIPYTYYPSADPSRLGARNTT